MIDVDGKIESLTGKGDDAKIVVRCELSQDEAAELWGLLESPVHVTIGDIYKHGDNQLKIPGTEKGPIRMYLPEESTVPEDDTGDVVDERSGYLKTIYAAAQELGWSTKKLEKMLDERFGIESVQNLDTLHVEALIPIRDWMLAQTPEEQLQPTGTIYLPDKAMEEVAASFSPDLKDGRIKRPFNYDGTSYVAVPPAPVKGQPYICYKVVPALEYPEIPQTFEERERAVAESEVDASMEFDNLGVRRQRSEYVLIGPAVRFASDDMQVPETLEECGLTEDIPDACEPPRSFAEMMDRVETDAAGDELLGQISAQIESVLDEVNLGIGLSEDRWFNSVEEAEWTRLIMRATEINPEVGSRLELLFNEAAEAYKVYHKKFRSDF